MAKEKSKRHQWTIKDIVLITLTALLLIILVVKSMFFDAYKPVDGDDFNKIEAYISETYDGFLYNSNILKIRVIEIKADDDKIAVHMRRYFLGVLPLGDTYGDVK